MNELLNAKINVSEKVDGKTKRKEQGMKKNNERKSNRVKEKLKKKFFFFLTQKQIKYRMSRRCWDLTEIFFKLTNFLNMQSKIEIIYFQKPQKVNQNSFFSFLSPKLKKYYSWPIIVITFSV